LTELMVGLVVIGMALAFSMPNMARSARTHKLRSAAYELQTALGKARSTAITQKVSVRLDFFGGTSQQFVVRKDQDNDGVYESWMGWSQMPKGVQMTTPSFGGASFVTFAPSGVPSAGGSIFLSSGTDQRSEVRLMPGSGAVTIETPMRSAQLQG
jgi:Tfp pilus assembly protein FimT